MSEASAGRLIDRLCADGLLQRQERYDDRRARAVYLTPAAEPLLAKLSEIGREGERDGFAAFRKTNSNSSKPTLIGFTATSAELGGFGYQKGRRDCSRRPSVIRRWKGGISGE